MERVDIDRQAYEEMLAIARSANPHPRVGLLGGTGGVVRSIYPLGSQGSTAQQVAVSPEEARVARELITAAGEELMGDFSSFRTLSDDGARVLPLAYGSGSFDILRGDHSAVWISIRLDWSPLFRPPQAPNGTPKVNATAFSRLDSPAPQSQTVQLRIVESRGDARFVRLGRDVKTGTDVRLSTAERRQGLYVIGKTGMGKSTLLESLIVQDMEAGLGLCLLDPHGDLVDAVLARVPPDREADVVLLDLGDDQYPFGLNLFECANLADRKLVGRIATQAVEVFEKLWGDISWGPQLAQVLRNCAYTLIANQGYTMTEIRRLLLDSRFRERLVEQVSNPQVREFWKLEYEPMRPHEQLQLVRSTLNKVDEFLTPTVYPIVGFGRTTVDLRELMDSGGILLVKLGIGEVGASAVSLIGSMLVGQIFNAALSRQELPAAERRQFNLYADEYHRFATPAFAELLAEARKYAMATTLAHQFRDQLTDAPNRGATLNAGSLVVFAVHGEDAEELAKQFDRTPPRPEIAGQRPKLSVSQDPIGHLVRAGHSDDRVRVTVAERLQELVHAKQTLKEGDVWGAGNYWSGSTAIETGLRLINEYLVELMEGRLSMGTNAEASKILHICEVLRGALEIAPDAQPRQSWRSRVPPETSTALDEYLRHSVAQSDPAARNEAKELFVLARQAAAPRRDDGQGPQPEQIARSELLNLDRFVAWLRGLGNALATTPILVDSGQWEPYFDKPRTYADIEAEIASDLVSMPKYRARYRVQTAEGTLHTPEFEPRETSAEARAMTERIKERTRERFCAPIETVLDSIAERQRDADPDSATKRRVSLEE